MDFNDILIDEAIATCDEDLYTDREKQILIFIKNMNLAYDNNASTEKRYQAKAKANDAITEFLFTCDLLLHHLSIADALMYIEIYLNIIDIYSMFRRLNKALFIERLTIQYNRIRVS